MNFSHGGDVQSFKEEYQGEILDFSANLNPLGMPEAARQAAMESIRNDSGYPDPHCRELTRALADYEGVRPEQILCGNGAADLIFRVVQAAKPRRAVLVSPCFSEYEQALRAEGCGISFELLHEENDFALTENFLDSLTDAIDMVFLCSPNNPTGACVPQDLLNQILKRCEEKQILLVLDNCFSDFLPKPPRGLPNSRNLLVLKAFTKFYGMAGLRLGYCMSHSDELLAAMRGCAQPWSVSAPAQAAGVNALSDKVFAKNTRKLMETERAFLQKELQALGAKVYPSKANYLLFRGKPGLTYALREKGILLRDCSNYRGLCPGYYRTAVRSRQENKALIAAIAALWKE